MFIIKSDFSFRHAFLKPGISVLGGINGNKASEVWTAEMPGMGSSNLSSLSAPLD